MTEASRLKTTSERVNSLGAQQGSPPEISSSIRRERLRRRLRVLGGSHTRRGAVGLTTAEIGLEPVDL